MIKDAEIRALKKEKEVLEADLLRANGLLTSRGLFEHVLRGVHGERTTESGRKGKFNSRETCEYLESMSC